MYFTTSLKWWKIKNSMFFAIKMLGKALIFKHLHTLTKIF